MNSLLLLSFLTLAQPGGAQELSTAAMRAVSMPEVYTLALGRSEQLAAQAEGVAQLDAAERQLGAAFRPSFDFNASLSKQQNADAASRGYFSGSYGLFSGMRDYLAAKAASSRTGAARLDLERARQQLYLSAAQAYLNLLAAQREVFIRGGQLEVTGRRIAELETRAAIGRSRRGEVVSARSQLAQDKASRLAALSDERLAQQALKFITGLSADLAPAAIELHARADLKRYLDLALARPDIQARRLAVRSASWQAEIQDRGQWPSVSLAANYYVLRSPMPDPVNRWDAGAFLNVPLYTGGLLQGKKEAAYSARRGAEIALDLAQRQALSEVSAAFEEYDYSLKQADSLAEALALADENARYQQEDYKLGLVTNLDVLNALNTAQQTRLALSQAQARTSLALIKLETAAGAELK
ncbi:MAG TPA: hypothetical protein DEQ38_10950 [Elusimicrobia bacterium]|nr:MAG: hypothetical protein A2089_06770 [Elusimicrobia bacterium GWD2_63_28]HCC48613.1 hypothetical protein [Elusimicrobiota bacterium]